nr:VTT domain-containing protein [uncultured Cohaesibacter sp.]
MFYIDALIIWLGSCWFTCLIGMAFVEHLVPIFPVFPFFILVGIAASAGHIEFYQALTLTSLGSVGGCLAAYFIGAKLGEQRIRTILHQLSKYHGGTGELLDSALHHLKRHEQSFALGSQLLPMVRLIAPSISGGLRSELWPFVIATLLGSMHWNMIFIGAGFLIGRGIGDPTTQSHALTALALIVLAELLAIAFFQIRSTQQTSRKRCSK